MAARLKLTVDWTKKKLIRSRSSITPFTLPAFFQGDVVPMQIQIVEPSASGGVNAHDLLDIGSMAMKLGVSDVPTGTPTTPAPFVTLFSWSKDTNEGFFYGEVAFNTTELNTFLGASASAEAYLELEITEGTAITTILQEKITIKSEVVETGTLAVAPGETALSLEVAAQMFAKKFMNPGETITFVSEDSLTRRITGVRNDKSAQDDVL